jgi:hypothetical protein
VPIVLVLLLCSALFSPPFDAARSATIPAVLTGDRYVVGLAMNTATSQPAQVAGYFAGAALAAIEPSLALLVNAGTFAVSALLVRFGLQARPAALDRGLRSHLLGETVDGFRLVFRTPALRSLALLVFCGSIFAVVPEGLGAAWAANLTDEANRGWAQGIIMGSVPLGSILGALTVTRLVSPTLRTRLLRPLALAIPIALVPAIFNPPVFGVGLLAGCCGFAIGAMVPIANGQFVLALPNAYRARAFGVVQGGLQLLQGGAVLVTGTLAHDRLLPYVVGLWSLGGVGLMLLLSLWWPSPRSFAEAIAVATAANASYTPAHAAAEPPRTDLPAPDRVEGAPTPVPGSGPANANGATPRQRGWSPVTAAARKRAPARQPGTMEQ